MLETTAQPTVRTAPLAQEQTRARPVAAQRFNPRLRGQIIRQLLLQMFLLMMLAIVMFPVLWIISMAIDPRGITRPTDLNLFPENATLDAFYRLLSQPFSNVLPLYFSDLLMNSLFIALGTSVATVVLGSSAAYAFSRFRFIGRQAGMLGFIILLMLPTTGIVIPTYIIFSAVPVNRTLANAFPAYFSAALVAAVIFIVYSIVRGLGKPNPERWFNPTPPVVAAISALIALAAITLALIVMFERSPAYQTTINAPLSVFRTALDRAQADYNQRVQSVAQRDLTATRREERAAAAAAAVIAVSNLRDAAAAASDSDALRALLESTIASRSDEVEDPEDDLLLQTASAALTALNEEGLAAAQASLAAALETSQAEADRLAASAASARANYEEAAANLVTAEEVLIAARDAYNADAQDLIAIRTQAVIQLIPYALLAWVGALIGAAAVWGITFLLRGLIEPRTLITILLWALIGAIIVSLGSMALESRLEARPGAPPTQTLRNTLLGLSLAFASGGLPFAIWNLKGYFDTIPKELEEAALIDGAGLLGTFIRVMVPLSLPAFAIVILFSFMNGWTEFILSWIFLTGETQSYTLAMALATMAGGANQPPPDMQKFAAMSILISLPIMILFFAFQRWIVGGLAIGGVKG